MGRRQGNLFRGRCYLPLNSFSVAPASADNISAGSRLHSVRGENSTSPTFDFVVRISVGTGASSAIAHSYKFSGYPNGSVVNLLKIIPYIATVTTAGPELGKVLVEVISGTSVSLQYYEVQGNVNTA